MKPFVQIIDNSSGSPQYVEVGTWGSASSSTGIWKGNYGTTQRFFISAGAGTASAKWTFTGVPDGDYDLFATWDSRHDEDGAVDGQAATNTPFKVYDDATLLDTVTVNQARVPISVAGYPKYWDLAARGVYWKKIGTYTISSGTAIVSISDTPSSGRIWADAVRLVDAGFDQPCVSPADYDDDFESAGLYPSWEPSAGTWAQSSGVLQQTNASSPANRKIRQTAQAWRYDHAEILAKVRVDAWTVGNANSRVGVSLNVGDTGLGYSLAFNGTGSGHDSVAFFDDAVKTGNSYTFNWTEDAWYWFRLRRDGNTLQGKVWADGDSEPGGWAYTNTTTGGAGTDLSNRTSGFPALAGNNPASFDDVSITQWDSATACSALARSSPILSGVGKLNQVRANSSMARSHATLSGGGSFIRIYTGNFSKTRTHPTLASTAVFRPLRTANSALGRSHPALVGVASFATPVYTGTVDPHRAYAWYKFDEASGAACADVSGNRRAGTAGGTTGRVAGKYANAINLSTTGYVAIPAFAWTSSLTVGFWYYANGGNSTNRDLLRTLENYGLYINTSNNVVYRDATGGNYATTTATIAQAAWTHVALVVDGGDVAIYLNGAPAYSGSGFTAAGASSDRIGYNGVGPTNGYVDDFRIYDIPLTSSEVSRLAVSGTLAPLARPHATLSGDSQSGPPAYSASSAAVRSRPTIASASHFQGTIYSGDAALARAHATLSGDALFEIPSYTGAAALSQHPEMEGVGGGFQPGFITLWLSGSDGVEYNTQCPMTIRGEAFAQDVLDLVVPRTSSQPVPGSLPLYVQSVGTPASPLNLVVRAGEWLPSHGDLPCSILAGDQRAARGLPVYISGTTPTAAGRVNLLLKGPPKADAHGDLNLSVRGGGTTIGSSIPLAVLNVPPAARSMPLFLKAPDGSPGAVPAETTMNLFIHWGAQGVLPLVLNPGSASAELTAFVRGLGHLSGDVPIFIEADGGVVYNDMDIYIFGYTPTEVHGSIDLAIPESIGVAETSLMVFINGWESF